MQRSQACGHTCDGSVHRCARGSTRQARCCQASQRACNRQHCGCPHGANHLVKTVNRCRHIQRHSIADLERLNVLLARHHFDARQPLHQVQLLPHLSRITFHPDNEERARQTTSIRKHADSLPLELLRGNGRQEGRQTAVQRRGVHVTATLCAEERGIDFRLVCGFGEGDEGLFEDFVREGGCVRDGFYGLGGREVGEEG